jgi:hypothetical protein
LKSKPTTKHGTPVWVFSAFWCTILINHPPKRHSINWWHICKRLSKLPKIAPKLKTLSKYGKSFFSEIWFSIKFWWFLILFLYFLAKKEFVRENLVNVHRKQIIVHTNIAKVGLPIVIMEGGGRNWLIAIKGLQSSMSYIMHAILRLKMPYSSTLPSFIIIVTSSSLPCPPHQCTYFQNLIFQYINLVHLSTFF